MRDAWALVVFLVLCFLAAGIGGYATSRSVNTWYPTLNKPSFNPPAWVFGPAWTVWDVLMAVAAWLVWRKGGVTGNAVPLGLFLLQLLLNVVWSVLFFGLRSPPAAFWELVFLWTAILATTLSFWRAVPTAGILFLPYLGWVTYAGALNYLLWQLNR